MKIENGGEFCIQRIGRVSAGRQTLMAMGNDNATRNGTMNPITNMDMGSLESLSQDFANELNVCNGSLKYSPRALKINNNFVVVQFAKWHGRPARENHAQDARATSN
jgi:hypothetical protein